MAMQAGSSVGPYSPHVVGGAFVKQYYHILRNEPKDVYKFYNDSSILGRSDSMGNMTVVTTIHDINEQLVSTDLTGCVIQLETVDSQSSHVNGVLILVTGSFTPPNSGKQKFTQSFFLAPQGNGGYFVLNDMFRFVSASSTEAIINHDNESTQSATLLAEPETASVKGDVVPNIPSTENMPVNDEVISPSPNDVSVVKNDTIETCVEKANEDVDKIPETTPVPPASDEKEVTERTCALNDDVEKIPDSTPVPPASAEQVTERTSASNEDVEKIPEAAPMPPASAEKEAIKKTYASIVMDKRDTAPPALAAKPKPKPRLKASQNVEKSVSSPSKPAHATNTAVPGDKNLSVKSPDEPGYSVFVKNLPVDATIEMVENEFRKFGAIKPGCIQVRNHALDRFCFGFVEFESKHSMEAAIKASPVCFGSRESYVEEKRTSTRVVNGVVTRGNDNGNTSGRRFQPGYNGGSGNYNDGENRRNQNAGRGRGPQGNGYHHNGNGFHQNRNGYHHNGNGYHQNGNNQNGNGYHQNGNNQNGNGYHQNGNNQNGNGYHQNGNGFQQRRPFHNGNVNGRVERNNGPRPTPVAA